MEGLGGRKEKGKMLYYNLKNKSTTITAKKRCLGDLLFTWVFTV